jgi:predicted DCC family thiol-disulfide oxidoreductase YuxK
LVADGRITAGFEASKRILLYSPLFYLVMTALIAGAPGAWWRRIAVALPLAFFFPLFHPVGESVYRWVARNRHRFSGEGACAVDAPPTR